MSGELPFSWAILELQFCLRSGNGQLFSPVSSLHDTSDQGELM